MYRIWLCLIFDSRIKWLDTSLAAYMLHTCVSTAVKANVYSMFCVIIVQQVIFPFTLSYGTLTVSWHCSKFIYLLSLVLTLEGRLKWPSAITRLTTHFTCHLMFDLVICKHRKSIVMHDTKCPYWHQMSLNNTKTHTQACVLLCIAVMNHMRAFDMMQSLYFSALDLELFIK